MRIRKDARYVIRDKDIYLAKDLCAITGKCASTVYILMEKYNNGDTTWDELITPKKVVEATLTSGKTLSAKKVAQAADITEDAAKYRIKRHEEGKMSDSDLVAPGPRSLTIERNGVLFTVPDIQKLTGKAASTVRKHIASYFDKVNEENAPGYIHDGRKEKDTSGYKFNLIFKPARPVMNTTTATGVTWTPGPLAKSKDICLGSAYRRINRHRRGLITDKKLEEMNRDLMEGTMQIPKVKKIDLGPKYGELSISAISKKNGKTIGTTRAYVRRMFRDELTPEQVVGDKPLPHEQTPPVDLPGDNERSVIARKVLSGGVGSWESENVQQVNGW